MYCPSLAHDDLILSLDDRRSLDAVYKDSLTADPTQHAVADLPESEEKEELEELGREASNGVI